MKKSIQFFFLLVFIFAFSLASAQYTSEDVFFYRMGKKINPSIDYSELLISFDHPVSLELAAELASQYPGLTVHEKGGLHTPKQALQLTFSGTPKQAAALITDLKKQEDVVAVYPQYWANGNRHLLQNHLLMVPEKGVGMVEILNMAKELNIGLGEIIYPNPQTPVFQFEVPKNESIYLIAEQLRKDPKVKIATPEFLAEVHLSNTPNDPELSGQIHLDNTVSGATDLDAAQAWALTTGSPNVSVAILDFGFDMNHPDLVNKYRRPYNAILDNALPEALTVNEHHGTQCAGIAGAETNNNIGVASIGRDIMIVPVKIGYESSDGYLYSTESDFLRASEHVAQDEQIAAVSMSIGLPSETYIYNLSLESMRNGPRNGKGALLFAATGNYLDPSEDTFDKVRYPGNSPLTLGITSCNFYDDVSVFAYHGPGTSLVAHGEGIKTTDGVGADGSDPSDYYSPSGTSMACPLVAGVVGLMASINPGLSNRDLEFLLLTTAVKAGTHTYSTVFGLPYGTWSNEFGYGRVNAHLAVQAAQNAIPGCRYRVYDGFESGLGNWTQLTTDALDWTHRTGSTPSNGTGPSLAYEGDYYMYVEATGAGGQKKAVLESPCMNLSNTVAASVGMNYHMRGTQMGSLKVVISIDGGTQWYSLHSISGDQGGTWKSFSVSIPSQFRTNAVLFRIVGKVGTGFRSDIAIDNVVIETNTTYKNQPEEATLPHDPRLPLDVAELKVYPNPSQGNLSLSWETDNADPLHISVLDLMGKTVFSMEKTTQSGENEYSLDLTHLPAGTYVLQTNQKGKRDQQKIVLF